MKTTMKPRERIELEVKIYRDLATQYERDEAHYEKLMATHEWAGTSLAVSKARRVTYELVANKLEEILKDWTEDEDDGK